MAYIVNSITQDTDITSTYVQKIPAGHQANDILLATVINNSAAGSAMTASGWTSVGATTTTSGASRSQVFWKLASSSSEADLSVSGQSAIWHGNITVIRGADTTSPIDVITNGDQTANAASFTGATTTTATNNDLVIHVYAMRTSAKMILSDPSALTFVSKGVSGFGTTSMYVGYRVQETAGATTASQVYYNLSSSNLGRMFVIGIKDANPSSPTLPPDSRNTYQVVKLHYGITGAAGGVDSFSRNETTTWVDVGSGGIAASTINGLSVLASTPTFGGYAVSDRLAAVSGITIATSAVDATGRWMGAYHTLSSYDFSGKIISLSWGTSTANLLGNEGFIVYFEDGSGNWAAFQLSGRIGVVPNITYTSFIAPGVATPYDSSGSIDWTDIAKVGYMVHRVTTAVTSRTWYVNMLTTLTNTIAYGGSADVPINASFYGTILGEGNGAYGLIDFSGSNQIVARGNIQIGDSSKKNYINLPANSIEQPQLPDGKFRNQFWQGGVGALTTKYSLSSDDTVSLSRSILSSPIEHNLSVAGSTPASFDSSGATFIKQAGSLISGVTYVRTTFDQCGQLDLNGAILDTCSVSSSTAAVAIVTNDPSDISDTAFSSAGTGHAIEITDTGTFDFTGNTFTDYGADGTTDAAIYNNSGGAVTLTLAAGDATPTIRNGAGASTTFAAPTVNVNVNTYIAGSRVRIYNTTQATQLYNNTPAGTSYGHVITGGAAVNGDSINIRVTKLGKTLFERNEIFSDTTGVTVTVSQPNDPTYDEYAIDGSTVTTIDWNGTNDTFEFDEPTNWSAKKLYAWYNYYCTTSTGIAEVLGLITPLDFANLTFGDVQFDNMNSYNLPRVDDINTIRSDDTAIVANPTTGGGGFNILDDKVYIKNINTATNVITGDISDVPTVGEIADAVWDEPKSGHTTAGSFGKSTQDIESNSDATQAKVDQL